jgi:hypothetical protein
MLEISPCQHKWIWSMIFIRIPKNASTSIYNHLGDFNLIHKHKKEFDRFLNDKTYRNWFSPTHVKPNEISLVMGNMVRNYMSFAIVRNPWDRAISMYEFALKNDLGKLYGINSKMTFAEFCGLMMLKYEQQDKKFIAIHDQSSWLEGMFSPNFVLRFENLKEDFEKMLNECGIKHISPKLPHENSSKRGHYHDYFDFKSRRTIEKIFERDIDTFKYKY